MKRCQNWLEHLLSGKSYLQPVRKKIFDEIGNRKDLELEQKEQVSRLMDQLLAQNAEA